MSFINNQFWLVLGIVVVLIAGLVYLGMRSQNTAPNQPLVQENTEQQGIGGSGIVPDEQNNVRVFEVEGKPFEFSMKEMRVKEGDRVKVFFNNTEGFHDFVIDGFNVRTKQLQAGEGDSVEFVADRKGTFEYHCSVGNHRQMGMMGNLIVE